MKQSQGHIEYEINYEGQAFKENERLLNFIPQGVTTILDTGCGRGEFLRLLVQKGYKTAGCDIDDVCLKKSANFAEVKKVDILSLSQSYSEGSFDLVCCIHLLEHVLHPYAALLELKRVTSKYILFAIPNARFIVWDQRKTHLYSWSSDTFNNLIDKAGLKVINLQQERTNVFPNYLRATPIINKILLKLFIGPNELIILCSK